MISSLSAFSLRRSGKSCAPYYFAPLILFAFSSASALELIGVSVEPSEIAVGKQIQITIDFKGQENQENKARCGILVNFGDGGSEYIRVEEAKLPLKLDHTYDRIGNFPLSAEGQTQFRGFNTTFACSGSSRSAAVNVRAENFAEMEAVEQAAKEVAFKKAAAERRAAERAAEKATAERVAAEKTAKTATAERSAAERATQKAAADRYAAEKAAASIASARAAAEKGAASAKDSNAPGRSLPPEAETPKKSTPIKARSAMDL